MSGTHALQAQHIRAAGKIESAWQIELAVECRALKLPYDPLVAIPHLQAVVGIDPAAESSVPNRVASNEEIAHLLTLHAYTATRIERHCRACVGARAIERLTSDRKGGR